MSSVHPKVKASATAGAVTTLVALVFELLGWDAPPEAVVAAVVTLATFVAGYRKQA